MTPTELRNSMLAEKLITQLKRRHYDAYYCPDRESLLAKIAQLIPEGSSVAWGGSMSIRDTGITKMLKEGNYEVYDREDVTTAEDKRRMYLKAFDCQYYLARDRKSVV